MANELPALVQRVEADISDLERGLRDAGRTVEKFGQDGAKAGDRAGKGLERSLNTVSGNARLTANQLQNLSYQANDVFTSLASGAPALQVLAQQGGQIYQALGNTPGGAAAGLKDLASRAAGLITSARLIAGGLTGAAGAAAFLGIKYSDAQEKIEIGLLGIGRASGATVKDINNIAAAAAETKRVTVGEAREIATALAATGKIGPGNIAALTNLAPGFARLTGQSTAEAGAALAKMFSDPAKGIAEMEARLGALDGVTKSSIRNLLEQGKAQDALALAVRAFTPEIERAAEKTSWYARQWQAVKAAASAASDAVGHAVAAASGNGTPDDRVRRAQERVNQLRGVQTQDTPQSGLLGGLTQDILRQRRAAASAAPDSAEMQRAEKDLQDAIENRDRLAKAEREASAATKARNDAEKASTTIESLNAEARAIQALQNAIEALQGQVADDRIRGFLTPEAAAQANATLDTMRAKLSGLREDYARGGAAAAQALKAAEFESANASASTYARAIAEIDRQYKEAVKSAAALGDAATRTNRIGTAEAVRTNQIAATNEQYLQQPSNYYRGVKDAPEQYRQLFLDAGAKYGLDPNFIASIAAKESSFNPNAIGPQTRYGRAQGMMQFIPDTAKRFNIDPLNPAQAIDAGANYLSQLKKMFGGNEALAAAGYNAGEGRIQGILKEGKGLSAFPDETQKYLGVIFKQSADIKQQAAVTREWDKSLEDAGKSLDATTKYLGVSNYELIKSQQAQALTNAAIQAGIPLSDELKASIDKRAAALANLSQQDAAVRAGEEVRFQRSTLGMTPDQQSVAQTLRSYRLDPGSDAGKDLAGQLSEIQTLSTAKSDTGSFLKSINADLMRGTSLANAMSNAFGSLITKMGDRAIDSLLGMAFGDTSKGGGGGGLLGSLISSLAGSSLKLAGGGFVSGPGTSTSDSIAARLSKTEFGTEGGFGRVLP